MLCRGERRCEGAALRAGRSENYFFFTMTNKSLPSALTGMRSRPKISSLPIKEHPSASAGTACTKDACCCGLHASRCKGSHALFSSNGARYLPQLRRCTNTNGCIPSLNTSPRHVSHARIRPCYSASAPVRYGSLHSSGDRRGLNPVGERTVILLCATLSPSQFGPSKALRLNMHEFHFKC